MADWVPPVTLGDEAGRLSRLLELTEVPEWYERAACRGQSGVMFAGGSRSEAREAKAVCADCRVIGPCRALALTLPTSWPGVYAGMTPKERCEAMDRKGRVA